MKRFLLAFALGVFVGSAAAVYFSSPDAYGRLQAAKLELLGPSGEAEPAKAEPRSPREPPKPTATPRPAAPPVEPPPAEPAEPETEPAPAPDAPAPDTDEAEPDTEPAPAKPEPERTLGDKAKDAFDRGAEAAGELAREGKEKAGPFFDESIDAAIATAIRAQFKLARNFPPDAVEIAVRDREVTLSGQVPDRAAEQQAVEIALKTKGVRWVESQLAIAE